MSSATTAVAVQYRLKEWAEQIVPVNNCLLQQETQSGSGIQQGLSVSVKVFSIHVTESTPMPPLAAVQEVVRELTPQQFRWLMEGLTIPPKKSVRPGAGGGAVPEPHPGQAGA